MFQLSSSYVPTGDQPQAIEKLSAGISAGLKNQVLVGVTGSGKTFTMANLIQKLQMPALIISHNKTLAGQLYQEMRDFFPTNGVSYFVSYYDYYQPEAYIPSSDTYIEKEADINDLIDKLRLQATTNIMTRPDAITVASVSCIYNIGSPVEYGKFILELTVGQIINWNDVASRLVQLLYERSEFDFKRGSFRIRGQNMDIYPAYEDYGIRVMSENGKVVGFSKFDPLTGKQLDSSPKEQQKMVIYPAKHYMTDPEVFAKVEKQIRHDLEIEVNDLKTLGRIVEAQRLLQKVNYDLEMIKEVGFVNGIENYSRYFDGRNIGDPPFSLLDYYREAYGDNFLVFIDESHMTVSQIGGMYNGDHSRKKTLIDFGFRLRAAFDNRPLKFEEFYKLPPHVIYVSATPNEWEMDMAKQETKSKKFTLHDGQVEQLIRPTGIIDPHIEIRPAVSEIQDLIGELEKRVPNGEKVLVTTLTKKTAEDLTEYLKEKQIRAAYLHSDVHTLERSDVLDNLRKNQYDVLIGVNLLREGLDLPEVSLVVILDADREGFLRSRTSLIQTMGRAARNIKGEVILYADKQTKSIEAAVSEIERRREYQMEYNRTHNITPQTILKPIRERIAEKEEITDTMMMLDRGTAEAESLLDLDTTSLTPFDRKRVVKKLEREMKKEADDMNFEKAIMIRDKVRELQSS
ncbi:excinuclease ABC subunit UvrB [Candidatus Roizmanbacteria bacterium]|nr:excinuclease ABC subunit UvrB [Candidatus Roizmanbacteria bacterium]